jgi:hypothetical protein
LAELGQVVVVEPGEVVRNQSGTALFRKTPDCAAPEYFFNHGLLICRGELGDLHGSDAPVGINLKTKRIIERENVFCSGVRLETAEAGFLRWFSAAPAVGQAGCSARAIVLCVDEKSQVQALNRTSRFCRWPRVYRRAAIA